MRSAAPAAVDCALALATRGADGAAAAEVVRILIETTTLTVASADASEPMYAPYAPKPSAQVVSEDARRYADGTLGAIAAVAREVVRRYAAHEDPVSSPRRVTATCDCLTRIPSLHHEA